MTDRQETRFWIAWATCERCGSGNVYGTHKANTEDIGPDTLTLVCSGCGFTHVATGMATRVVGRE